MTFLIFGLVLGGAIGAVVGYFYGLVTTARTLTAPVVAEIRQSIADNGTLDTEAIKAALRRDQNQPGQR